MPVGPARTGAPRATVLAAADNEKRPRADARDRFDGDPSGIRTRVTAVRGQRTRPLYDGAAYFQEACASNRFSAGALSDYFIHSASVSNRKYRFETPGHKQHFQCLNQSW